MTAGDARFVAGDDVPGSAAGRMPSLAGGNSRPVLSAQQGIHRNLARLIERHRAHRYRRPVGEVSRLALDAALRHRDGRPLILDSGCGVGESTAMLAARHPEAFVLGIDKSADRLSRLRPLPGNARAIRADLVDVWRALAAAGVRLSRHYLLYPNPWPKPQHLARRWHGHAVFPELLALGGVLELRSNWRLYVEEFATAVAMFTGHPAIVEAYSPAAPISPFERKYLCSGQALHRLCIDLDGAPA
jgi:tRNA (guanine-N7-)-methyltransferase